MTVYPDYYKNFKCTASECSHNCCIGWEIDIDTETMAKYDTLIGDLGDRLSVNISRSDDPHFILAENGRCPFLNSHNLCELILHGGEDMLCQICSDHPRFRNFLPGYTETGLGLCCEAAAELILTHSEPVIFSSEGSVSETDTDAKFLLNLRKKALSAAQDRSTPLSERCQNILRLCGVENIRLNPHELTLLYLSLERLDNGWTIVLENLNSNHSAINFDSFKEYMSGRENEYEQLLVYFLYRHFLTAYYNGDIAGKAAFAVMSVWLIYLLGALHYAQHGVFTIADQIEYARMYSSEVEYSQENLDKLFDALN